MYNTYRSIFGRCARLSTVAVLVALAVLLGSCGGGGGGGGLPPVRTDRVISGVGFDGPVINGVVKIYDFSSGTKDEGELIGQGTTDERGRYRIELGVGSRPILVEVTGGRYIEEATGKVVAFGEADVLRAVYNYEYEENRETQVAVTFYTHMAAGLADYRIRKGDAGVAEAINQANARFSEMLGVDITQVLPQDVTDSANAPKDDPATVDVDEATMMAPGLRYGFMTAAISQWTEAASRQNGADEPHGLFTSLFFAQRAYEDIQWDGVLNGQKESGPIALGNVPVNGEVYRNDLALNALAMAASPRNATGFTALDVLEVADAYSSSALVKEVFGSAPEVPPLPLKQQVVPTVTILAPEDGKVLAGIFTASASVLDQGGLKSVTFFIDTELVGSAENLGEPSLSIDTAPLADGDHRLTVVATNVFDNSASETSTFTVANKGTMIGNVKPADGAFVRGTFTMSVDVVDPVGVRSVVFKDDAGNTVEANDAQNPAAEMNTQIPGSALSDGQHAFTITSANNVGSELSETVNYTVDNTLPQVTLNGVRAGEVVRGTVLVTGAASDTNMDKVQVLVDGQVKNEFTSGFGNLAAQVDTATVPDGQRPFVMRANDKAGNVSEKSAAMIVDNTAPGIRIRSPASNDTVSGSFVFSAQVLDPTSGVNTVEVRFNGGNATKVTPDSNGIVTRTIDVKNMSGAKTATVTALDRGGNRSEASVTVMVDNNAPQVIINGLSNDEVVRGPVDVTVSAEAAGGVRLVDFKVDGNVVQTFNANFGSMGYTINTDALSEGEHIFEVFVVGQASNASAQRRFIVDRSSPLIIIGLPGPGDWLGADILVSGQINDPNLASAMVTLAGNTQTLDNVAGDFSTSFDLPGINGRDRVLEVSATDKAGNSAQQSVSVNIDTAAPNVTSLSPADGTQVQGTFRAVASAQDGDGSGVASGAFFFAGLEKSATRSGDEWIAEFSADEIGGGEHVLEFEAVDAVGNRSPRVSRTLVTDNTPPEIEIASLQPGTTVPEGTPIQLRATVTDAASSVAAVQLTVNGDDHPLDINGRNVTAEIATDGRRGELLLALTARDTAGNTSQPTTVRVTVVDSEPPVLALEAPAPVEATSEAGAVVNYTARANDAVDGPVTPSCTPASGEVFRVGETTVRCTVRDARGNEASGSFTVTVQDTTQPTLNVPADMTAEATSGDGAEVTYTVTASDLVEGQLEPNCSKSSGSRFPIGTTAVECTATDSRGNRATASFNVTVADTSAPALNLPGNITAEATGPEGAAVTYTASANDAVEGDVGISCTPASGAVFPLGGPTEVLCTARDSKDNAASGTFTVTVQDTTAPTLTGEDIVMEAQFSDGAPVNVVSTLTATDAVDPNPSVSCLPSEPRFNIGVTPVTCVATDSAGNQSQELSLTVTVTPFPGI